MQAFGAFLLMLITGGASGDVSLTTLADFQDSAACEAALPTIRQALADIGSGARLACIPAEAMQALGGG